jgi:hypothetical protein
MNTTPIAPRLFSLMLAALVTSSTLAGIDALAHNEHAANGLMARAIAAAIRPA